MPKDMTEFRKRMEAAVKGRDPYRTMSPLERDLPPYEQGVLHGIGFMLGKNDQPLQAEDYKRHDPGIQG